MDVIETAQALIAIDSVTSHSNHDVSQYMHGLLRELNFEIEALPYHDAHGIEKNCLAARRGPPQLRSSGCGGGIGFFCHNDVVSVDGWNCSHGGPFAGVVAGGRLWGRGACDMKGPTAAALAAISTIDPAQQTAPLYFFVTGDEECGMAGARLLASHSAYYAELVAHRGVGIIGEPTALRIVNAHKGGCHIDITSTGVAAHSSTADGRNANWAMIPFLTFIEQLNRRCETESRFRNEDFSPPTLTMNLVIENRPSSTNITVGQTTCRIFFRPMPSTDWESVLDEIQLKAESLGLEIHSQSPLKPLYTPADSSLITTALQLLNQTQPQSVSYATDGCCFEQLPELLVIGPGNIEQAHRPDEWIDVQQLLAGVEVYQRLFRHYTIQ